MARPSSHAHLLTVMLCVGLILGGCRAQTRREEERSDSAKRAPSRVLPALPLLASDYAWGYKAAPYDPIARRFAPPEGFERVEVGERSWAQWLRHLPLEPQGTPVVSEWGAEILPGRSRHLGAVVDLDVRRNQECADVILRLRAEYLLWDGSEDRIAFKLTGGGGISWPEWKQGMRPKLEGDRLAFHRSAEPDDSRRSFDAFLDAVFTWCGTYSLSAEGHVVQPDDVRIGHFFVRGGSPGHAVLIADLAGDPEGNRKAILLQGYIPAQSARVLAKGRGDVWFDLDPEQPLDTPLWGAFEWSELRRFDGE